MGNDYFAPLPIILGVIGSVIAGLIVCCCYRRRRRNGRVLAPPRPAPPAPQQHCVVVAQPQLLVGSVATYPVQSSYPTMPQPVSSPYPAAAPPHSGAQYPAGGAQYPAGGAQYPGGGGPQYPMPAPYPMAPTAPQAHALPPSYEHALEHKQSPYNPNVPH